MFELEHGKSTIIFTKPYKSDYEGIMNFDVKAAQPIYIKLVRIPDEDLLRPSNCINKKLYNGEESRATVYRVF